MLEHVDDLGIKDMKIDAYPAQVVSGTHGELKQESSGTHVEHFRISGGCVLPNDETIRAEEKLHGVLIEGFAHQEERRRILPTGTSV